MHINERSVLSAHQVETVVHLFLLKLIAPEQVVLLRGNHDMAVYEGEKEGTVRDFVRQCAEYSDTLASKILLCFEYLPLAERVCLLDIARQTRTAHDDDDECRRR